MKNGPLKTFLKKQIWLVNLVHGARDAKYARLKKRGQKLLGLYGKEMAIEIEKALQDSQLLYFYAYGSLLGLIRDGHFIPHDADLDMGLLNTSPDLFLELDLCLTSHGFVKVHEFSLDGKICEVAYSWKKLKVDFFLYEYDGEEKMDSFVFFKKPDVEYNNPMEFSVAQLKTAAVHDIRILELDGIAYRVPANAEAYLADAYGDSWRIPNPNWSSEESPAWHELEGKIGIRIVK